jgi:hypothetical protein
MPVTLTRRTSLLLVLAFIVSLPAVTPRIYASDEIEYFSFLRSLWFDHDLSFDNEYRHFADAAGNRLPGFRDTFLSETTPTGHRKTFATIGCALLWAPFYAVADAGVRAARLAGAKVAADGYSPPYVAAVAYGSAVYGLLALLLSVQACALMLGSSEAGATAAFAPRSSITIAVLAVWLGTPLLFYMYVAPPFSHAASAFAVAAFIVAWLRVRRTWSLRGMAVLGVLAALMTMVREQDVLFVGGVALDFAWMLASRLRGRAGGEPAGRLVVNALCGTAAAAIAYLPQAIAYLVVNGALRPSPHVTRKMTWTAPHAWEVLASADHGFVFWTPLAVLAIAGLMLVAIRRPPVARVVVCMLVMVALQVYVAGSIESWTVGGGFGQRRFVGLSLILVVGVAGLLMSASGRAWRRLTVAALVLAAWWNVALIVQFGAGLMDRQKLTLGSNAYHAFVVVPRSVPRLIYRYLFDRNSFYAAPAAGARVQ